MHDVLGADGSDPNSIDDRIVQVPESSAPGIDASMDIDEHLRMENPIEDIRAGGHEEFEADAFPNALQCDRDAQHDPIPGDDLPRVEVIKANTERGPEMPMGAESEGLPRIEVNQDDEMAEPEPEVS